MSSIKRFAVVQEALLAVKLYISVPYASCSILGARFAGYISSASFRKRLD